MCPTLKTLLEQNKIVIGLLVTAGIATMPAPESQLSWKTIYTWFHDCLQLFLNLRRPMPPTVPPSPPSAQPKP